MSNKDLCEKIKNGLLFLFLGQEFNDNSDVLFDVLDEKYHIEKKKCRHDELLDIPDKKVLEWMQGQSDYLAVSYEMNYIARLPWNGIITSSVVDVITKAFENTWREVYSVSNFSLLRKNGMANNNRVLCSFLFGNIYNDTAENCPPTNLMEFLKRKAEALKMLSNYTPGVLSPYGIFIIEGYDSDKDWLKIEDLVTSLSKYGKGQVQYFGGSLKEKSIYWKILCDEGIIEEHEESFVHFLADSVENNYINIDEIEIKNQQSKLVSIEGKSICISQEKYNDFSKDVLILDDSILLLPKVDKDNLFFEYKHFLYESGHSPVWGGYRNEFDFVRDKEELIESKIDEALEAELGVKTIIVHGQTGTGKSTILGRLAYEYKVKKKYPILFIPSYASDVVYSRIRELCEWFEEKGAKKTLIFWDGNFYNDEIAQYNELAQYLISLGKKIVLIGSSHRLNSKILGKYSFETIEIEAKLSNREVNDLLFKFNKYAGGKLDEAVVKQWNDESIIVALYRMLPATRNNIRKGVVKEATKNSEMLKEFLVISEKHEFRPFEKLFMEAGIVTENYLEDDKVTYNFEELLNYVCVPAQFGIYIPFSLVLQCLGCEYSVELGRKVEDFDFFRLILNEAGEYLIYVRNSLEAQIVLNNKLADLSMEVDIIKKYIMCLGQSDDNYYSKNIENFIVQLLKAAGPNGVIENGKYEDYYYEIAAALKELRENGTKNTRLILQEASYLREYAKKADISDAKKISIFEEAKVLLENADKELSGSKNTDQIRGKILSELATNYGTQLQTLQNMGDKNPGIIREVYNEMIVTIRHARGILADSFHALDVCAWASTRLLKDLNINDEWKIEIYTNAYACFEQALFAAPSMVNLEQYNTRLLELSDAIGNTELSKQVFEHLIYMKSASGIYWDILSKIKGIDFKSKLNKKEVSLCEKALGDFEYFETEYHDIVEGDINCLYLKFKLVWAIKAQKPMLYREKDLLFFSNRDWEEILKCINNIINATPYSVNAMIQYIRFVALFHLNRKEEWIEAMKTVQHLYYPYDKRIITNYIASDSNGKPRIYHGEIVAPIMENKIMVRISELKMEVPCFQNNFVRREHIIGERYSHIELGFNFLGVQVVKIDNEQGAL